MCVNFKQWTILHSLASVHHKGHVLGTTEMDLRASNSLTNSRIVYNGAWRPGVHHYSDAIMSAMASQITGVFVYSTVCSGRDLRKHQSSASLAFVRGIHRWPVNSPHKGPVTRKMFPLDNVIMIMGSIFLVAYLLTGFLQPTFEDRVPP